MIKVILCNTIDEYMQYENIMGAKDSYLIDVLISGECSEIDAIGALDVLKNSKARIVSEAERIARIFDPSILVGMEYGIKEGSKIKRKVCCEKCGASVESSEQLTSMPILKDYNNEKDVCDQLGTLDVCPSCLVGIAGICNAPF